MMNCISDLTAIIKRYYLHEIYPEKYIYEIFKIGYFIYQNFKQEI